MNSLVDDLIRDDVNRALEENKYPWIKPIVELVESTQNPFLSPDFFSSSSPKDFLNDAASAFYLSSGYEMKVTFDEADYLKLFSCQFTDIAFSTEIADRMRTLRKTHRIYLTFKLNSIESPFSFIEPMMCTAFLYDRMSKCVISDLWNFVPEKCQSFFKGPQYTFDKSNTASFLIDPSIVTKSNGTFIILFSHPLTVDNGINTVLKYYQNPSSISTASATKPVNISFAKNPNAFSTFCWSYVNLSSENINNLEFPAPFLIDHSMSEGEISELISEAQSKHLKQVPFSISMDVIPTITPLILRQVSDIKIMPYLTPIHQLSIHLHQLKMSALSSARNIMIRVSFVSTEDNLPLFVIRSKYNSNKLVEYEYSRVCYHEKSPKFDDYFLIDLPYPLKPTSALIFQIYHVHVKATESKSMTEIGKAVLPLFQSTNINKDNPKDKRKNKDKQKVDDSENSEKNEKPETNDKPEEEKEKKLSKRQIRIQNKNKKNNPETIGSDANAESDGLVFIPDDTHTLSVSSDKTSKLIVSTYLRSNIISNDKKYNKFTQIISDCNANALDSELIKSISPVTLTENLMLILDRIIKMYEKSPFFNFEPILSILNAVLPYLKAHQLNRYLLLYVFYFAFRDTSKTNVQINYQLNDKQINSDSALVERDLSNHQPLVNEGKETNSLIDLEQVGFNKKPPNSETLIDFGNDSLFKNVHYNSSKNRRPSLILQSLYKESDSTPIHIKMLKGVIQLIKEKETEAINLLHPVEPFINGFLIKSLAVSKDRYLTDDFIEFVDLYTKYAAKSDCINETATSFGKFVDLLFDIGLPTAASVANSAFIRNCPLKNILTYVSIAYRPEYFLYSVRSIENFVDVFCKLVTLSFSGDNCSVMQPFFNTINQLCLIYDDSLKDEVASKLLNCLTTIIPSKIPVSAQISDGVKFIIFILTYCNETSMKSIIAKQKLPTFMSLIHYLLNKSTEMPVTQRRHKIRLASLANSEGVITIQGNSSNKSPLFVATTTTTNASSISSTNPTIHPTEAQNSVPPNISLIKTCSSFEASKNLTLESGGSSSIKQKNYFESVKVKRPKQTAQALLGSNTKIQRAKDDSNISFNEGQTSSNNSINIGINESFNTIESSIIAPDGKCRIDIDCNKNTQIALFRFITVFLGVSDLNGGAYLLQFAYHALQLRNMPKPFILQSYHLLNQVILMFSPGIIDIYNPCMTKVIYTLFKMTIISSNYHKHIASIIVAMFNRDFQTYKNNNRSFAICTRAISMIHYSQLTLERFIQFMKLLRDSSLANQNQNSNSNSSRNSLTMKKTKISGSSQNTVIDGLKEFYEIFEKLRSISVNLGNPKLTPSQKAKHLIQRFYAFKYSPDAQFIALEDLKRHQVENDNNLEAMNITILQAALIYEYLVKLNRMPNFFYSKFGGKHKYHLISHVSSVEAILLTKSQNNKSISPSSSSSSVLPTTTMYLIGSTSLCPSEIMNDIPKIPSFCDSETFSEAGFVSLLYKCLNEAENIGRTIISNFILDFIWPIYDARCLYGQMGNLFDLYEKIFNKRLLKARSDIRPKVGQSTQQQQVQLASTQNSNLPASAPVTPSGDRCPLEGPSNDKKNTNRNSRITKNRRSTRNKKSSDLNEGEIGGYFNKDSAYDEEFDNVTVGSFEDSENHNTFFRVMFCGKIFESDNGRAFIYRAEPGTTCSQFTSQLNKYYEFLMGKNKIIIINDEFDKEKQTNNDEETNQETQPDSTTSTNENNSQETNNTANNDTQNKTDNNQENQTKQNIKDTQNKLNNNQENQTKQNIKDAPNKLNNNQENQPKPNIKDAQSKLNNNQENQTKTSNKDAQNIVSESEGSSECNANSETAVSNESATEASNEDSSNNESSKNTESTDKEDKKESINNTSSIDDIKADSVWKMDDNIGYIKVDKVTEVNFDERAPAYQHQVFYVDECVYSKSYNFSDDLFFNSSHNDTNSSNFSNIYSFFNTYNNFNSYSNNTPYVNIDSFDQSSTSKNTSNYNYTYFNIYNYINNYMKKYFTQKFTKTVSQKKLYKKLAKRKIRRNFLAVRSQLPALIERSEIIKVEAAEFSPIMCAYQHLSDFTVKMKKLVGIREMIEIQKLLISELTENKTDNFEMIIDVFILSNKNEAKKRKLSDGDDDEFDEEEEEEEESEEEDRDQIIDDIFKEPEQKIRKNRKDFEKIVPSKMMGILKLFLDTLESGVKLHGKWIINNLQFVPLQYQFEFRIRRYETKFNQILSK